MRYVPTTFALILALGIGGLVSGCGPSDTAPEDLPYGEEAVGSDLEAIQERGELVAITGYGPVTYFLHRGQPMGYEYELLERLAAHLEVDLDIRLARNVNQMIEMLRTGRGDLIAYHLTVTKERAANISFTDHHTTTHQVLVQRKPEGWRDMPGHRVEQALIREPHELADSSVTVHVTPGTVYERRLEHLSEEIGEDITVQVVADSVTTEDLIRQVHEGAIDYTVADENIARINQTYLENIDVDMPLSLSQRIAWGVRKTSPQLETAINQWISRMKTEPTYNVIYDRYYEDRRGFRDRATSGYSSVSGGKVSPYDDMLRQHAETLDWDWRLLAALVYQESQFNPSARSWAGAVGLMQIMPRTARQYGATDLKDPADNLRAGTRYLQWLKGYWTDKISDPAERKKFVLGSYNVGLGHVQDARRLAEKYGKNPDVWTDHVAYFLKQKSDPAYYRDPVVQYGYCRGEQPTKYVSDILRRYRQYESLLSEQQASLHQ